MIPAPCNDSKLIGICSDYGDTLPCCEFLTEHKERSPQTIFAERSKILWGKFNCADLFELKEDLLKTNYFTFRPISWCMFPVLQKGDITKVEHVTAKDINPGDIPVYRREGKLFAHRAVGKKIVEDKIYIVTQPDMANDVEASEAREEVPEEDVLGRIVDIRRRKKIFSTDRKKATLFDRTVYVKSELSAGLNIFLTSKFTSCITAVQFSRPYMWAAKKIVSLFEKEINLSVVMPSRSRLAIYEYRPFKDLDISRLSECKHFHVLLKVQKTPVGYMTFINRPQDCPHKGVWWSGGYMRLRYRGTGLGKILLARSEEFLKKSGIPHIRHPKNPQ